MTSSSNFKRCAAFRPDGERCKRLAQADSQYCHSHRHYQPKHRPLPTLSERVKHYLCPCVDCNRLVPPGQAWIFISRTKPPEEEGQVLCEPCLRLRGLIEGRIMEIVEAAPGHSLSNAMIYEDLERFGVDQDLTEAARLRLLIEGRLVDGRAKGEAA